MAAEIVAIDRLNEFVGHLGEALGGSGHGRFSSGLCDEQSGDLVCGSQADFEIPRSAFGRHSHDGGRASDLGDAGFL